MSEIQNIQDTIDELYISLTKPNKDYPNNTYFREYKEFDNTEDSIKAIITKVKDTHIAISHYISFSKIRGTIR